MPALDLIQFFLVFSVCFIILLVFVGAGYKIKQRYDFYRRRQRMVIELEALAKRPYPAGYLELTPPRMLVAFSHLHQPPLSTTTVTAQIEHHPAAVPVAASTSTGSSGAGGLLRYGRFARSSKPPIAANSGCMLRLAEAAPLSNRPKYLEDAFSLVITKEAAATAAKSKSFAASTNAASSGVSTMAASSSAAEVVTTPAAKTISAPLVPKHVVPLGLEPFGAAGDKHAVLSVVILLPHDLNTGYTPCDAAPFAIGSTICTLASGATRKALFSSHLPKGNNTNGSGANSGVRFFKRRPQRQDQRNRAPPPSSAVNVRTSTSVVEHRGSVSGSGNINTRTVVRQVTVRNNHAGNSNSAGIDYLPNTSRSNALRQQQLAVIIPPATSEV